MSTQEDEAPAMAAARVAPPPIPAPVPTPVAGARTATPASPASAESPVRSTASEPSAPRGTTRSPSAVPTATRAPGPTSRGWLVPMLVLMMGSFMSVLDSSIVNTAIPTMQKELGASADEVAWVATGYTLALGVVVPVVAWASNRVGTTLLHRYAMVGFALASALCGMAWDINSMIVFRVLQAIPGGVLPVVTLTILYRIVPPAKIGSAMGIYGLGVIVAPAIGPTVGGYFVDDLNWRLIFYVNVPIGIVGAILGLFLLPRIPRAPTHRFDLLGFLTVAYGLFALLLATSKGQEWHWDSYAVLGLLVSGVLSLALFVVIENEVEHPLLDLRALLNWPFVNSLIMIGILMVGLFSVSYYIPQFLQEVQGLTALNAGELLLPQALVMAVLMPFAGRVYDRFGPRWPALIGLTINAYGTYLLADLSVDMTHEHLLVATMIRAVGTGLALMPIMTNGLNALPRSLTSYGSALNNIMQRVSSALGVAVLGALVAVQSAQGTSDYGALVPSDTPKQMLDQASTSRTGFLGYYQWMQLHVTATAYDDVLMVTAVLSALCIPLALLLRKPRTVGASAAGTADVH